jgi:acetamidase/formamidase
MDAYLFVSHNVQASIAQMVDPQYTVMAKLLKNRLPPAKPPSTEAR